jgi:hypothetical protein
MDVADFEAGAVTGEAPGSEGGQAAFVGQLGQRIDLVHELAQLGAAEEVADDGGERLGIDELLGRHRVHALVEERHALLDQTLGAGEADAALVGEQFADRTDAAAAQVIDVIQAAFALLEHEQVAGGGDQVLAGEYAGSCLSGRPSFWLIL